MGRAWHESARQATTNARATPLKATPCVQQAVRDALIAFMAATAQAQAEATKEAQKAGIEHAKAKGQYLGRKPSYSRDQFQMVMDLLSQEASISTIAKATGLSRQTIYRISGDRVAAEAVLVEWKL